MGTALHSESAAFLLRLPVAADSSSNDLPILAQTCSLYPSLPFFLFLFFSVWAGRLDLAFLNQVSALTPQSRPFLMMPSEFTREFLVLPLVSKPCSICSISPPPWVPITERRSRILHSFHLVLFSTIGLLDCRSPDSLLRVSVHRYQRILICSGLGVCGLLSFS